MPTVDLIIKGGTIYTASGLQRADIAVDEGKIIALGGESVLPEGDRTINAANRIVVPGLIDTHTHLRDPGLTHKEDVTTGTMAAAAGGITLVVAMPNVKPPINTLERFLAHISDADKKAVVDFGVNPSATIVEEIPKLVDAGAMALKLFMVSDIERDYPHMPGIGVADHGLMFEIFEAAAKTGKVLMVHPHDQELSAYLESKFIKAGKTDAWSYHESFTYADNLIWRTAVATIILLAEATGVRLHIMHMFSKECIEMLRQAKARGLPITAETNPWSLFLNEDDVKKMGPYVLGYGVLKKDTPWIWRGVKDGTIDIIATDHAPHTREEKEVGWEDMWKAPGGEPHLEHYLSLLLTEVNRGAISLERVVDLCSEKPARIFGLFPKKGAIQVGSDADLVILDMKNEATIKNEGLHTKCGWTPYARRRVKGTPILTMVRGHTVMEDGVVTGKPGYGQFTRPTR
ncbi:MAG: amidohydrolase family protein [Nitrososphaeria archaeon]|nr:amidohydrolase family protein [Nitrososphaeria archaeon]NIN52347.1 amidohydrolase family protein [Nitrososphaeria archaeon]NIQ32825.1 amidohydrolase family protein [Nitrososphaeria archaeon]